MSHWRAVAIDVIDEVVSDNPGLAEKELRKKISEAYPFGERKYWPYKVWLSEVKMYFTINFPFSEPPMTSNIDRLRKNKQMKLGWGRNEH